MKPTKITERTVNKISPILHGLGPQVQGAVLANLFAMYLAGHVGTDAGHYREQVIEPTRSATTIARSACIKISSAR